jgi:hypothetical protein
MASTTTGLQDSIKPFILQFTAGTLADAEVNYAL